MDGCFLILRIRDDATHLGFNGAHDRNRTCDLFLTKEVLYRLSYVSLESLPRDGFNGAGDGNRTRTISLEG